ncbi:DUF1214 domain-containing protein [Croceicoccus marinus]|uniref:DUF1214 domain-containing protein n=1 Tax=Croceicoccus marinus TaxID=450378 RepID=A0A1Z1FFV5_9SPHN|nr:DUF1214 domain-containing protein [Croceicoccus marinus]ARU17681.1 hypothetical protein A9D14_14990 [Croceicoccus marinus]QNE07066.1 DUF1214 domain-containing protein [Croceicoccus marinus]
MNAGGLSWEKLVDELRPLGDAMRARVPERLRSDPRIMAESMRLLLAGLARASSDALVGDRRHPMFVPELNIAQNIFQPNADTIYKSALIEKGGSYLLRGDRGTVRMIILAQMGPDTLRTGKHSPLLGQTDFDDLTVGEDGSFEVVVSPERPAGYTGNWAALDPQCEKFMVRIVSCDWGAEREPRFGIARLDVDDAKGRLSADDLHAAFDEMPFITRVCALAFPTHVEELRDEGYLNKLKIFDVSQMSGLKGQFYYEGAYELADDEALISEVRVPQSYRYWSIILTNELYETTDWYNNQASLNDVQGVVDPDGVFRAVISSRDPGVHNWLDTSGYPAGAIQGRWFEASEKPMPTIRKVKIDDVLSHLPEATRRVSPQERSEALRDRRLAAQMRIIW